MSPTAVVDENQLDQWVRGNAERAKGTIVELVHYLVSVSCPRPDERRFPLGDSINQPGPDGLLLTETGFNPFVPDGQSMWEIGTGINARAKATRDYQELTASVPADVRAVTTFVFCTPLSGRREWANTWKKDQQGSWRGARRRKMEWLDVRVVDGTMLIVTWTPFPLSLQVARVCRTVGSCHVPATSTGLR